MHPPIVVEPILSTKRSLYFYGKFWILDESTGNKAEIHVDKKYSITGTIHDPQGKTLDHLEGNMFDGVKLKSSGKLIAKSAPKIELSLNIPEAVLKDPYYSRNVWSKVFHYMTQSPPDYDNADIEKSKVEQEQRKLNRKEADFQSRYGFPSYEKK